MTREALTLRRAARVLLLDEDSRVLLVRLAYRGKRWWAAPGGGHVPGHDRKKKPKAETSSASNRFQRVSVCTPPFPTSRSFARMVGCRVPGHKYVPESEILTSG